MTSRTASTHTKGKNGEILFETLDQKTDVTKLWRTIKGIDGRAKREARERSSYLQRNLVLIVQAASHQVQPTVQHVKLGRHTFSSETRLVTRETKRKSLEMAQTFTTDLMRRAIKSCRNREAFGPDKLSIFHLKTGQIGLGVGSWPSN